MRRLQSNSFGLKITLTSLFATTIAVVTLMIAYLLMDAISSRASLNARLATLAAVIGQNSMAALSFGERPAASEVLGALRAEPPIINACLYDSSGRLFAQYQREIGSHSCPQSRELVPAPSRRFPSAIRRVAHKNEFLGDVLLVSDVQELETRWRKLILLASTLLALALTIGGVAGRLLQRKIVRPISDLAMAMHKVAGEQLYSERVNVKGNDEIAGLGNGFNAMLTELERRESLKNEFQARLEYQASNDALTGLPNRRFFGERLDHTITTAQRDRRKVAVFYIDLDGFKLVNDSLGHSIGDSLLVQVAGRFRTRVRKADTLARIGGDEFTLILDSRHAREEAIEVANALLETLTRPFDIEGHQLTISASIGISIYPENSQDSAVLMQQADGAMYAAKRNGKNQAMYFTPELGTLVRERLNLENQLRDALAHGDIHVNYQPEFDVESGKLIRFEALARWNHSTLGKILPDKFIPVAEESGLIVPLGAHILEQACIDALKWQTIAPYPIQVAVNVSSTQFARAAFVEEVIEILKRTGLSPGLLQLELTESVMIHGIHSSTESMKQLKALGVTFAIDDFGTGYSCLSYLPALPFDALKIDRSFIRDCDASPDRKSLVMSLITLAQNIGLRVIVEGIETKEQLAMIRALGGDEMQGYLLGVPVSDPSSRIQSFCNGAERLHARTVCDSQGVEFCVEK